VRSRKLLNGRGPNFDPRLADSGRISLTKLRLQAAQNDSCGLLEALARLAELTRKASNSPVSRDRPNRRLLAPRTNGSKESLSQSRGADRSMEGEGAGHELIVLVRAATYSKERCCPESSRNRRSGARPHQQVEFHCLRLERQAELLSIDLDIRSSWWPWNMASGRLASLSPLLLMAYIGRTREREGGAQWPTSLEPCAPRRRSRCGEWGVDFGHSSPSLTDLRPASLGFGTAVTDNFVASPVSIGEDPWKALHEIQLPKRAQSA